MKVYVFPGQGSQKPGMGLELYQSSSIAKELFETANDILGFGLSKIMFEGSEEELRQTKVTQPAVFLNAIASFKAKQISDAGAVAGHSLGEFTALVANNTLSFDEGLKLVYKRALAMQKATELADGTMAAILGMEDEQIESICNSIEGVVPANYNCPGQLVISGSRDGIEQAVEKCQEAGARRAIVLPVGGAFHSPLMEPARANLEQAIREANFQKPECPIYQNVTGNAETDAEQIRENLVKQLTSPVRWTQTMKNFVKDGMESHTEVGAKVLTGFIRKLDRTIEANVVV